MVAVFVASSSCEDTPPDDWDFIRVVVDTNASVPDELDAFSISVERSGTALFSENYDIEDLASLPDSMVIVNETPSNDSPEKLATTLPFLTVTTTGYLAGDVRVTRSATLQFNAGQVQLPLPLCTDCLQKDCENGLTCKRGQCVDASVGSLDDLPSEGSDFDPLADCGPSSQ